MSMLAQTSHLTRILPNLVLEDPKYCVGTVTIQHELEHFQEQVF
jgi:hypothetical protein